MLHTKAPSGSTACGSGSTDGLAALGSGRWGLLAALSPRPLPIALASRFLCRLCLLSLGPGGLVSPRIRKVDPFGHQHVSHCLSPESALPCVLHDAAVHFIQCHILKQRDPFDQIGVLSHGSHDRISLHWCKLCVGGIFNPRFFTLSLGSRPRCGCRCSFSFSFWHLSPGLDCSSHVMLRVLFFRVGFKNASRRRVPSPKGWLACRTDKSTAYITWGSKIY